MSADDAPSPVEVAHVRPAVVHTSDGMPVPSALVTPRPLSMRRPGELAETVIALHRDGHTVGDIVAVLRVDGRRVRSEELARWLVAWREPLRPRRGRVARTATRPEPTTPRGRHPVTDRTAPESPSAVVPLTAATFDAVVSRPGVVVIEYGAPWCAPCRQLAPAMERLAAAYPDVTIASVDIDAEPDLARAAGVMSVPTVRVHRDGRLVAVRSGSVTPRDLERIVLEQVEEA